MNDQNESLQLKITIFIFLLSGVLIYRPIMSGTNLFWAVLASAGIGLVLLPLYNYFYAKAAIRKEAGSTVWRASFFKKTLYFLAVVILLFLCAALIFDYTAFLTHLSPYYESKVYMVCVALCLVILCAFAASGEFAAVTRLCALLLFALPVFYIASYFALFYTGILADIGTFSLDLSPDLALSSLKGYLLFFSDIVLLMVCIFSSAFSERSADSNTAYSHRTMIKKTLRRGFLLAAVVYIAESVKNLLLFGENLLDLTIHPGLAAAQLIPGFDIPEIYTVTLTIGVLVKEVVYLYCIRIFWHHLRQTQSMVQKMPSNTDSQKNPSPAGPRRTVFTPAALILALSVAAILVLNKDTVLSQHPIFLVMLSILTVLFPILTLFVVRFQK